MEPPGRAGKRKEDAHQYEQEQVGDDIVEDERPVIQKFRPDRLDRAEGLSRREYRPKPD